MKNFKRIISIFITLKRMASVFLLLAKAGTYKATFDDQTGEFKLLSGKKVVANATARMEKVAGPFRGAYSLTVNGESHALVSMNMNSTNQAVIINDSVSPKLITP